MEETLTNTWKKNHDFALEDKGIFEVGGMLWSYLTWLVSSLVGNKY